MELQTAGGQGAGVTMLSSDHVNNADGYTHLVPQEAGQTDLTCLSLKDLQHMS